MAFKFVVLFAALACANGGYLGAPAVTSYASYAPVPSYGAAAPVIGSTFHGSYAAPAVAYSSPSLVAPAITSQHSNIIRSFGNLGQVSTYSKSIDTPFSSVRKADIRVSNPGLRTTLAAPALAYSPAISTYHGYGAPAIAAPVLRTAVAAPILRSAVASPVLHTAVAAPAISTYATHPIAGSAVGYAGYGIGHAVAAPAALGVAYSAAPAVSHINYASTYANYGW